MWSSYRKLCLPVLALILTASAEAIAQDPNASLLHVFPVVVDGALADGTRYRTSITLQNGSNFTSSCWIGFQGSAPPMIAPDGSLATGGLIQQHLQPGTYDLFRSTGVGSFTSGYAWISCSAPITAYAVYSSYVRGPGGNPILTSETTVTSSAAALSMQFINDGREDGRLALSIANDEFFPALVRIQVFDVIGRFIAQTQIVVPAKSTIAKFLNELVSGIPARHMGPVRIDSSQFIYATGLRFTGPVLTSIPPTLFGVIR